MANMDLKRHEMPTQLPEVRAHNFFEVALGYDEATAISEAERCLNCKHMPCVNGCPVNIHIPEFIANEARKPVGIAENHTEAIRITAHDGQPVLQSIFYSALKKCFIKSVICIFGKNTD